MKAHYHIRNLDFEVEGDTPKALFKNVAEVQEIFGADTRCGNCRKANLHFRVRTVDDNDYFELLCLDCFATLSFGQHKNGKGLFPKRKDADGKPLPNRGWTVWAGKGKAKKAGAEDFNLE